MSLNGLSRGLSKLIGGLGTPASGAAAFTPASLPGLAPWFTAGPTWCFTDAGATVPAGDGAQVYTWLDRSGAGRTASQPTLASRPTLRLIGGYWRIVFDGVDDYMQTELGTGVLVAASPSFYQMTYRTPNATCSGAMFTDKSGTQDRGLAMGFGTNQMDALGTNLCNLFGNVAHWNTTITHNQVGCAQYQYRDSGTTSTSARDGVSGATATAVAQIGDDRFVLGGQRPGVRLTDAHCHEIIVCTGVVSAADRAALLTYSRSQWGTP